MNKENMLAVADLIEQHENQFNMSDWGSNLDFHRCGTTGCIAGFAALLHPVPGRSVRHRAEAALGIYDEQADQLFIGEEIWGKYADELGLKRGGGYGVNLTSIKSHHAVTMLRNLANGVWSLDNE